MQFVASHRFCLFCSRHAVFNSVCASTHRCAAERSAQSSVRDTDAVFFAAVVNVRSGALETYALNSALVICAVTCAPAPGAAIFAPEPSAAASASPPTVRDNAPGPTAEVTATPNCARKSATPTVAPVTALECDVASGATAHFAQRGAATAWTHPCRISAGLVATEWVAQRTAVARIAGWDAPVPL
jgi:hypothetical protein